ncbi:MAG: hypothetical protein PHV68_01760 [Candidatus Gastranaerophilales bacterium]|nr:hypothetical protein [Candidatus Gastranaerophilales bacterium]
MENTEAIFRLIKKQKELEAALPGIVSKYAGITNPELEGKNLMDYKKQLADDIAQYVDKTGISVDEVQTEIGMARISFERLVNASKKYYVENCINPMRASIYKIQAKKLNDEYKSLCLK